MKEYPLSNCEKELILNALKEGKRIDGREVRDFREVKLAFGAERGHVEAQLGSTRVLCKVTCEVSRPSGRPTDGHLFFNVELSPMASPSFEPGRPPPLAVELCRVLERSIREARAIDLESLCIVSGEKVWSLRIDVHVLNHCGGLATCCSLAAITALSHFRRPDVSVVGDEVTIHSPEDRSPVPLNIYFWPLCVTVGFFPENLFVVDPSWKEERVMLGQLCLAMNDYREVCMMSSSGGVPLTAEQITHCVDMALQKVKEMTDVLKKSLAADAEKRSGGSAMEIDQSAPSENILKTSVPDREIPVSKGQHSAADGTTMERSNTSTPPASVAHILGRGTAELGVGGRSAWDSDDDMAVDTPASAEGSKSALNSYTSSQMTSPTCDDRDSEEEDQVVLTPNDLNEASLRSSLSSEAAPSDTKNQRKKSHTDSVTSDTPTANQSKKKKKKAKLAASFSQPRRDS